MTDEGVEKIRKSDPTVDLSLQNLAHGHLIPDRDFFYPLGTVFRAYHDAVNKFQIVNLFLLLQMVRMRMRTSEDVCRKSQSRHRRHLVC